MKYYEDQNYEKAFIKFTEAAIRDHPEAQFELGYLYESGLGTSEDRSQAIYWYKKPASDHHNDEEAQYNIGFIYYEGKGNVQQDFEKALYWLKKSAENDYAPAQNLIGKMFQNGQGVTKDYEKAFQWHTQALSQKDATAQHAIGVFYRDGLGVEQSYQTAIYYFELASNQKHVESMYCLGLLYDEGRPGAVPQNHYKAFKWFSQAAGNGHGLASYKLGLMYYRGQDVTQNDAIALDLFKDATDQHDIVEVYKYMALIYQRGCESEYQQENQRNCKLAVKYYKKATDLEDDHGAQYSIVQLYFEGGFHLDKDVDEAMKWIKKSANNGNLEACIQLGGLYFEGMTIAKDYKQALYRSPEALDNKNRGKYRSYRIYYSIGSIYWDGGNGIEKDNEKALKWLLKAGDESDSDSFSLAGLIYSEGDYGVDKDYNQALKYLIRAAEFDPSAQAFLEIACIYREGGYGIDKDYEQALSYYLQAAERADGDDSEAEYGIGFIHYYCDDGKQDGLEELLTRTMQIHKIQ